MDGAHRMPAIEICQALADPCAAARPLRHHRQPVERALRVAEIPFYGPWLNRLDSLPMYFAISSSLKEMKLVDEVMAASIAPVCIAA